MLKNGLSVYVCEPFRILTFLFFRSCLHVSGYLSVCVCLFAYYSCLCTNEPRCRFVVVLNGMCVCLLRGLS